MDGCNDNRTAFDYHGLVSFDRHELEIVSIQSCNRTTKVFRHQRMLPKIAFFLLREGIVQVWHKVISARFASWLARQEAFVIFKDPANGMYWWGYQHSRRQPVFYFLPTSCGEALPSAQTSARTAIFDPFLGHCPAWAAPGTVPPALRGFKAIVMTNRNRNVNRRAELFLIGCGDYVRTIVLPAFKQLYPRAAVEFNYEILGSHHFDQFEIRTNDFIGLLQLEATDARKVAVIASYHSYHASQAVGLLRRGEFKVVIEKPPCVTFEDLQMLAANYDPKRVFICYNRRHIPWNWIVKDVIAESRRPVVANINVTETQITKAHWYFAPMQGTRICGNLCHWVDLAVYLMGRRPRAVSIARNTIRGEDYSSFSLLFDEGSIFNFTCTDLGDGTRGVQEHIHLRSEDLDIRIMDYLSMSVWNKGRTRRYHAVRRNKGHRRMYKEISKLMELDEESPYTRDDLISSTLAYLGMLELHRSDHDSKELDFSLVAS